MSRSVVLLLLLAGCSPGAHPVAPIVHPVEVVDAGVSLPSPTDASPPSDSASARSVLDSWNDAHSRHDTSALSALYAAQVSFYASAGETTKTPGAECVKRKAAAFAKAPDYAQSVRDARFMPDGSGGVYVEFSKVSTTRGKSTTYDGYLYIDDGRIVAEGDGKQGPTVRWNWCVHDIPLSNAASLGVPRDEAIGGYKVSPLDAVTGAMHSKHVSDLRARSRASRLKAVITGQTGCPYLCAMDDPRGPMADPPCENKSGAYTLAITDASTGTTIEEVQVDAMANVLRWGQGGSKQTESLGGR